MQKSMNKHRKAINTATPTVSKMRLSALMGRLKLESAELS